MLYYAIADYPFTVDYYKTQNTVLEGPPVWQDTYIETIKVQLGSNAGFGKLSMYTAKELSIGYILKNFKDINGNLMLRGAPNNLNLDTSSYRINSCDPQLNSFGWAEGFMCSIAQLNAVRAA